MKCLGRHLGLCHELEYINICVGIAHWIDFKKADSIKIMWNNSKG